MSGQHTQGRLTALEIDGGKHTLVGDVRESFSPDLLVYLTEADARRLAACWNACEGIDTTFLEGKKLTDCSTTHAAIAERDQLRTERDKVRAHRDELLRQISAVSKSLNDSEMRRMYFNDKYLAARALLREVVTADDEAMKTRGSTIDDMAADNNLVNRIRALIDGKHDPEATARGLLAEVLASLPDNHSDPLVDRIRGLLGPAGGAVAVRCVEDMAARLVDYAAALCVVVTVSQKPRLPLAMGNYDTVFEVRPARGYY